MLARPFTWGNFTIFLAIFQYSHLDLTFARGNFCEKGQYWEKRKNYFRSSEASGTTSLQYVPLTWYVISLRGLTFCLVSWRCGPSGSSSKSTSISSSSNCPSSSSESSSNTGWKPSGPSLSVHPCTSTYIIFIRLYLHSHGIRQQWSMRKLWQIFSNERHWSRDVKLIIFTF